jgi:hypothetical protein
MRRAFVIGALVMLPLIGGCPFDSRVSLGDPGGISFDLSILGDWNGSTADGDSLRAAIFRFNENEYYVEVKSPGTTDRHRVYLITIGDRRFFQLDEITDAKEPPSFVFGTYEPTEKSGLRVRFVGDALVPRELRENADGLRAFIAAHADEDALYDAETELYLKRAADK